MLTLRGKPYFLFPDVLKRWCFQNCAGIWPFLYYLVLYYYWWYFFFPKIWSYTLDGSYTSSINFSYSLSLKVNWVHSLQYLFYRLLYMARAVSRIRIHCLFFHCPIFGVRNNIWDQICVTELSLQLESRSEARRTQAL